MTEVPTRLLLLEDNAGDARLVQVALAEYAAGEFAVVCTKRLADALARIQTEDFDAVLSDLGLPDSTGLATAQAIVACAPAMPLVVLTGSHNQDLGREAIRHGAQDYLVKGESNGILIARTLRYAIERKRLEGGLRAANEALEQRVAERTAELETANGVLRESEDRYRDLVENSQDLVCTHDLEGKLLSVNTAAVRLTGYAQEALLRMNMADLLTRGTRHGFAAYLNEIRTTGAARGLMRIRTAGGETRWWEYNNTLRTQGVSAPVVRGMAQDITERRQTEEALRESEARFRSLTEMSSDFYWESDVEHRVKQVNASANSSVASIWYGQIGKRRWEFPYVSPDEAGWRAHRAVLDAHQPFREFELSRLGADGTEMHLSVSGDPVFDVSGAFTGYRGVGTDITERRRQEQKIARLSRIQTVMSGINTLILRVRDRDELFRETCRIAVKMGQFRMAWLGMVDRGETKLRPVAWEGADAKALLDKSPAKVWEIDSENRGLSGQAIWKKEAMIVNDIQDHPGVWMKNECLKRGIHSLVVLPLLVQGEGVGTLSLYAEDPRFFDEEEMRLLLELAGDISFALDHIEKAERLNYLAYYDSLTGLANRTLFLDRLSQPLHAKDAGRSMVALALLDLVRFRVINDTLGRQAGDELLRLVAQRLGAPHAGCEPPARVGVNCFALELSGMRDPAEVAYALEGILRSGFGEPFQVQGTELRIAAKCGVAVFPSDGGDAETLFRNAEAALARAKRSAEAVMFYAPAMNARVSEALAMENKLRKAIELGQFVLHYQPKVTLADNRITGVEALIRWNDPETGLVPPGRFIPVLEETGMIFEVGRWAMQQAVAQHRAWASKGFRAPRVAVNVSPLELRHRDFVAEVKQVAQTRAAADFGLDLEITESVIMEDFENNIAKLKAARNLGVNIAIDDFGTGYSSLSYLAKLPVTALKIDRSFIIEMTEGPEGLAIVSTIINLAHMLKLKVVAEGVESEEQSKLLKLLSCDEMQGYLFSKPIPAGQLEALLARNPPPPGAP